MLCLRILISYNHGLHMGKEGVPQSREVDVNDQKSSKYISEDYVKGVYNPHAPESRYYRMKSVQIPQEDTRYYLQWDENNHDAKVGDLLQGVKFGLWCGFKRGGITEEDAGEVVR